MGPDDNSVRSGIQEDRFLHTKLKAERSVRPKLKVYYPFPPFFFFLSNRKTRAYMFNFPEFTFCLSILIKTKTIDPESSCPCI